MPVNYVKLFFNYLLILFYEKYTRTPCHKIHCFSPHRMLPLQNKDNYGRDMLLNVRLFGLIKRFNCSAEKNKSLGLNLHFDGNICRPFNP